MKKNSLLKKQIVTAGDMSGDITSSVTQIEFLDNVGVQMNFTGTPTGTFTCEVSADYTQDSQGVVTNAGTWIAINLGATLSATGAAGTIAVNLNQLPWMWVRIKYTRTSGTGTLNAFICAKAV